MKKIYIFYFGLSLTIGILQAMDKKNCQPTPEEFEQMMSPYKYPLTWAAKTGNVKKCKKLLKKGENKHEIAGALCYSIRFLPYKKNDVVFNTDPKIIQKMKKHVLIIQTLLEHDISALDKTAYEERTSILLFNEWPYREFYTRMEKLGEPRTLYEEHYAHVRGLWAPGLWNRDKYEDRSIEEQTKIKNYQEVMRCWHNLNRLFNKKVKEEKN